MIKSNTLDSCTQFQCVCVFIPMHVCLLSHFSSIHCNPMNCSPPGSSVHGILQARIPQWVAVPSSRGSFWLRDWTHVSCGFCIAGGFFTTKPQQEAHISPYQQAILGHQPGVWEFNSILTLSTQRLNQDYTSKRLTPSPPSTLDTNSKPRFPVLQRFPWSLPWVRLIC